MEVEKRVRETAGNNLSPNEQNEDKKNNVDPEKKSYAINADSKADMEERFGKINLASESKLSTVIAEAKGIESESSHNHDLNEYQCKSGLTGSERNEIQSNLNGENKTFSSSTEVVEDEDVDKHGVSDDITISDLRSDIAASRSNDSISASHSHGSHRSPDAETKAEYRKIKEEVTGEGETSESEGDDQDEMPGLIDVESNIKQTEVKGTSSQASSKSEQLEHMASPGSISDKEQKEKVDEWIDILGNGLLKKRVLKVGQGRDTRPDRGQIVMLRTAGRLDDGTAVDWNMDLQFILGDGEVIQALDLAVALMEAEEVCQLVTDAKYAYGSAGRPDSDPPVPPNSRITYELELLCVREGPNIENMKDEERIQIADKKRELGNQMYSKGDYSGAIHSYQRAIKYLDPSTSPSVQEAKIKCFNNLAAAQLKIKALPAALSSCARVLQLDPDNVKAVFRKGKVLAEQKELMQAISHLKKANLLDPGNKTIRSELTRLRRLHSAELEKERSMYEKMVGGNVKDKKKKTSTMMPWTLVIGATIVAVGGIVMAIIFTSKH